MTRDEFIRILSEYYPTNIATSLWDVNPINPDALTEEALRRAAEHFPYPTYVPIAKEVK